MIRPRLLLAAYGVLGGLLISACGSDAGETETPTMEDLTGGSWVASGDDSPDHDLVEGTSITLTFGTDSISVHAGCNTMNGAAKIENGDLVVGDLASTLMACEDALDAQDRWVNAFLTAAPTVELSGEELTLTESDTEIRFQHTD
jgi:heat shock protein HslJ